ncbi:hypothetical protein LJC63_05480 [Ruminococcaceae bacterium OttesenSCG-928-L11]|nr:hypothetical protein [Ruminococcaceae bacterium OttesenSCG-928-L11]
MAVLTPLFQWTGLTGFAFLFVLLPLFLVVHRLLPEQYRAGGMLGISLVYMAALQPLGALVMMGSVAVDYLAIRTMKRHDDNRAIRRASHAVAIGKSILLMGYALVGMARTGVNPLLGIVVCALSGISMVDEMYRRTQPYELDFLKVALYCCFFPRLFVGPLVTYEEFNRQMLHPDWSLAKMLNGAYQLMVGAFKAAVLGAQLRAMYVDLAVDFRQQPSVLCAWLLLLVFALAVYFLMSGYGDMAQGLALLFGYAIPKNFYYPYQARNVTDFFERFHSTAVTYIRRFLGYLPDKGTVRDCVKLLLTGGLLGLWFGLRLPNFLWGLYLSLFVLLEKYVYPRFLKVIPVLLGRVYGFLIVLSGMAILSADSGGGWLIHVKALFGLSGQGVAVYTDTLLYILASNWVILLSGCFLATNLVDVTGRWISKTLPTVGKAGRLVLLVGLIAAFAALTI